MTPLLFVLGLVLPPTSRPIVFTGSTLGVAITAEVASHDPSGCSCVARLDLTGAMLGGSGRISGFARVDTTGRVTPSPHLRAQFQKRNIQVVSVADAKPLPLLAPAEPTVPREVIVRVRAPVFAQLSVRLARVGADWEHAAG